jgi:hypothetical protein
MVVLAYALEVSCVVPWTGGGGGQGRLWLCSVGQQEANRSVQGTAKSVLRVVLEHGCASCAGLRGAAGRGVHSYGGTWQLRLNCSKCSTLMRG